MTFESVSNINTPNPQKLLLHAQKKLVIEAEAEDLDTNPDDIKIDEEGVEDHEIIDDDEPDMSIINMNKVRFEMKKFEQKKVIDSNLTTPYDSALNSKQKHHGLSDQNPEDSSSVVGSKVKKTCAELNKEGVNELKERLTCVSCMENPRCMLIHTCKHVPFCQPCDQEWKLKCADEGKDGFECPICRLAYKKTTKINFI